MLTYSFPDELITLEIVPVEDNRFLRSNWERAYRAVAQNASYIWRRIGPGRRIVAGFATDAQVRATRDKVEQEAKCGLMLTTRFAYRETVSHRVVEESLVRQYLPEESNPIIARFMFTLEPSLDNNLVYFESALEGKSATFLDPIAHEQAAFSALNRHFITGYRWRYPFAALKITLSGKVDVEHYSPQSYLGDAFGNALYKAEITLIEPIMRLQLDIPAAFGESVLRDLRQRGINAAPKITDERWLIDCEAYLSALYDYRATFASLTDGQGILEMTRLRYREVPPETLAVF